MNKFIGGSDGGYDMPSQVDTKIGYTDGAQPTPPPADKEKKDDEN